MDFKDDKVIAYVGHTEKTATELCCLYAQLERQGLPPCFIIIKTLQTPVTSAE